ncbi:ABSCISIC ACID-INSENSITIVE 5-like protein 2 [Morella rubra]|uniref:ABSCISIC ACID-INSENSITIVE 5-like protein 2 n=1 Tax=Morella rubra TaxID=262757 RepID=A0A6A1WNU9_9ROSI|nr:ABSCISIC ACID-INSENSITIVE 5-like protein 2 [Morella rubra]
MGSQGGGDSNGKQSQFLPLVRQNSMYSLTLDEVQNQLGDLGKPLSSMNLDELLKNVWTAEANQSTGMDIEGTAQANQTALQHQASLSLTSPLSKKTVDEVWRDIQQSKDNMEKKCRERQPTLGEMTLEDFLVKAGVVAQTSSEKKGVGPVVVDQNVVPPFAQQGQWMQYAQQQYQHPQQSMMGVYLPGQPMPQPLHMGTGAVVEVSYSENQVALPSPLMGTLSDTQMPGRKRGVPEDMIEKTVERRQKRMIKNRESAARSRARKQAYTNELENKVSRLEEENERLRKRKNMGTKIACHVNNASSFPGLIANPSNGGNLSGDDACKRGASTIAVYMAFQHETQKVDLVLRKEMRKRK